MQSYAGSRRMQKENKENNSFFIDRESSGASQLALLVKGCARDSTDRVKAR